MQFSNVFLTLLAATTALAAPAPVAAPEAVEIEARQSNAKEIRIVLLNNSQEFGRQVTFTDNGKRQTKAFGDKTPIQTVELRLGKSVKSTLRCQILDNNRKPITVKRGTNVATTFADGGKGAWTLQKQTQVSQIICDPAF